MISWYHNVLRDPNPAEPGSGGGSDPAPEPSPNDPGGVVTPEPTSPPAAQPPAEVPMPKSKAEWDKLASENPQQWIKWTQPRMDQILRESRESREKLAAEQQKNTNLNAELQKYRTAQPPETPAGEPQPKDFSRENMPKTDEEWSELFIDDPKLATDLRWYKNQQDTLQQTRRDEQTKDFAKCRKEAAQTIWDRHPDMYVAETDAQGQPLKDEQGKIKLKIDPETRAPIPNMESEKMQLFVQVYTEDPQGFDGAKYGPRLIMAEMENRLKAKGMQQVTAGAGGNDGQGSGGGNPSSNALPPLKQNGTLPSGTTPPVRIEVKFSSDEEKAHAVRAVARGTFKSLEEYCLLRDNKDKGVYDENRTPSFSGGKK